MIIELSTVKSTDYVFSYYFFFNKKETQAAKSQAVVLQRSKQKNIIIFTW